MSNAFSPTLGARDVACGVSVFSDLCENLFSSGKRHRRTRSSHARKKTYDTRVLFAPTFPEIFALITCTQALGVANRLLRFPDRAVARGLR